MVAIAFCGCGNLLGITDPVQGIDARPAPDSAQGDATIDAAIDAGPPDAFVCTFPQTYAATETSYSCAQNMVNWDITQWTFSDLGNGNMKLTPTTAVFPDLVGTLRSCSGSFSATVTISGGCCETYQLSGTFDSETTWQGTFSATFCESSACGCPAGDGLSCDQGGCSNQSVPVSGTWM